MDISAWVGVGTLSFIVLGAVVSGVWQAATMQADIREIRADLLNDKEGRKAFRDTISDIHDLKKDVKILTQEMEWWRGHWLQQQRFPRTPGETT